MLSHDNIRNFHITNFQMVQHHKYSLTEIEEMMPWERQVYIDLLVQFVKEENERIKENK